MFNFSIKTLLLLLFLISSFLHGISEPISFSCSHKCGEWGSAKIQEIEWEFAQLLYQADKIQTFLSEYSKPYDPLVSKNTSEFIFSFAKPKGFQSDWYQAMIRYISEKDWIRLRIDDLDAFCPGECGGCEYGDPCEYCQGSRCYAWGILPMENERKVHVGNFFIRRECNYVEETYDDEGFIDYYGWYYREGNTFSPCFETRYRLDRFIDFKQACFDLNQELIWLRDEVHGLHRFMTKQKIKHVSDIQYKEFLSGLEDVKQHYNQIFSLCSENHQAPSAFYHIALEYFEIGDHARGLQSIKNVLERVDLRILEPHLASTISFSQGSIQNEIALYDKALLSLKKALDYEPKNKKAYFDQALVFFEQGKFNESIESYLKSELSLQTIDPTKIQLFDFSIGLIKGITFGATDSLAGFIPSMCSSLYGLSHGLWAFACSPIEVSQEMAHTAQSLARFLSSHSASEIFQTVIPELKELAALSPNQNQEKGLLIGSIIGKYGIEFLTLYGSDKALKIYRDLKKANGALALQMLTQTEKAEKLQTISKEWWKKTAPIIEEMKSNGGRIGDKLYKAFQNQNLSEVQVRRILHQAGFKTFPRPKGIPANATVQISQKNGGMVYIKAGTTEEQCLLIRVMPGNPKSPNPIQQKPYVIQRRGNAAVAKNGMLVKKNAEEAHIPLSEFAFKDW